MPDTFLDNGTLRIDLNPTYPWGCGIQLITVRNCPDGVTRYRRNRNAAEGGSGTGIHTGGFINVLETGNFGAFVDGRSIQDAIGQWNPVQGGSADGTGNTGGILSWDNDGTTFSYSTILNMWWGENGYGIDNQSNTLLEGTYKLIDNVIHIHNKITYTGPDRRMSVDSTNYWQWFEQFYDKLYGETHGGPSTLSNWHYSSGFGYLDDSVEEITTYYLLDQKTVGYFGNAPWTGARWYGDGPGEDITTKDIYGRYPGVPTTGTFEAPRVYPDERWIATYSPATGYGVATFIKQNVSACYTSSPDQLLIPYDPVNGTVLEFDIYRGYGNIADLRSTFQSIATGSGTTSTTTTTTTTTTPAPTNTLKTYDGFSSVQLKTYDGLSNVNLLRYVDGDWI